MPWVSSGILSVARNGAFSSVNDVIQIFSAVIFNCSHLVPPFIFVKYIIAHVSSKSNNNV